MPTLLKYMNKVASRLLPYKATFYIIAAVSAITILIFLLQMYMYKELTPPDLSNILPVFAAGILYLWSFGLILVTSWFIEISVLNDKPTSLYLRLKSDWLKFSQLFATIFLLLYFCFSVVFTFISVSILLNIDF